MLLSRGKLPKRKKTGHLHGSISATYAHTGEKGLSEGTKMVRIRACGSISLHSGACM